MLFLDGVGLGPAGPANPFSVHRLPAFRKLAGEQDWTDVAEPVLQHDHVFKPIDANLSMEGLPQSGTGQAALFTGVNAATLAGKHHGPFPHSATKEAIAESNVFQQVLDLGLDHPEPAQFTNAFPPIYFEHAEKRNRWSVTTLSCRNAGLRIRTAEDVMQGKALTAEITGKAWRERLDIDVPILSPEEAGTQWAAIGEQHHFSLFEYFLTDKAGHGRLKGDPSTILFTLDGFLEGFLKAFNPSESLLVLSSDHGNLEDVSTKSHTRYPVPLVAYGHRASAFSEATSIMDVTPTIISLLKTP